MKKWIWVVVIVGVVVAVVATVIYFRQAAEAKAEQARAEARRREIERLAYMDSVNATIVDTQSRIIALKLGEVAGLEYKLCKTKPPTLEKNRAKCQYYDEYLEKLHTEEEQHPSW